MTINQVDKIHDSLNPLLLLVDGKPLPNQIVDKYNIVVGKFLKFDKQTRILTTELGYKIYLPEDKIDRSKFLVDKTKKFLNTLI